MPNNLAAEVTERILSQLKAGTCPWKQPWTGTGSGLMPRNAVTGRAYSGVYLRGLALADEGEPEAIAA
jgi:antirestriction protein ArdC